MADMSKDLEERIYCELNQLNGSISDLHKDLVKAQETGNESLVAYLHESIAGAHGELVGLERGLKIAGITFDYDEDSDRYTNIRMK